MPGEKDHRPDANTRVDRRAWLASLLAGWALRSSRGDEGKPAIDAAEEQEIRDIQSLAKTVGLGPFRVRLTPHFLGIGNASVAYSTYILQTCEAFNSRYLQHFRGKGFELEDRKDRLTVVTLADAASYAKFLGSDATPGVVGVYNEGTNRVAVYDVQPREQANLKESPWITNLSTIAHELTHQLTFNTGLLSRQSDIPRSIGEGLAMYGEVRTRDGRAAIGQLNLPRLNNLWTKINGGTPWIPLSGLFLNDDLLQSKGGNPNVDLAYAQSWVLVDYLMTDPTMLPKFRDYLKVLALRRDPSRRLEDVEEALGPVDRLEAAVQVFARRLTGPGANPTARRVAR